MAFFKSLIADYSVFLRFIAISTQKPPFFTFSGKKSRFNARNRHNVPLKCVFGSCRTIYMYIVYILQEYTCIQFYSVMREKIRYQRHLVLFQTQKWFHSILRETMQYIKYIAKFYFIKNVSNFSFFKKIYRVKICLHYLCKKKFSTCIARDFISFKMVLKGTYPEIFIQLKILYLQKCTIEWTKLAF